jgi:hypothetical protein
MRVRQIGSIVFDNSTNIVVDATALDAVGSGFRVDDLYGPQPFSVEIAFVRQTRQLVLEAVDLLVYDLYIHSQRRVFPNVVGGAVVWLEDKNGNPKLRSFLTRASVNLINIENSTKGVIARVRVTGTLISLFTESTSVSETFSSLKAYGLYTLPLSNINQNTLAIHNFRVVINNNTGLRNALFVFAPLSNINSTRRIYRKNPSSVSENLTLESFTAEPGETLQRARFVTGGDGTITYNINESYLARDTYNLFFEVYLPFAPSSDVFYKIKWDGQQEITGFVDFSQTFINAGVYVRPNAATNVTIQIINAPVNTYISPLVFIPVDGVFTYNVCSVQNLLAFSAYNPSTELEMSLYSINNSNEVGVLRGPPGFIAGKYLELFAGMMTQLISNLTTNVTIISRRISPSSFM